MQARINGRVFNAYAVGAITDAMRRGYRPKPHNAARDAQLAQVWEQARRSHHTLARLLLKLQSAGE